MWPTVVLSLSLFLTLSLSVPLGAKTEKEGLLSISLFRLKNTE